MGKTRTWVALTLSIIFIVAGGGCWDRREINDLSFVMAFGLEKTDQGNVKITVQVAKSGELVPAAPTNQKPYWIISGEGRNIFEAVRNLSLRTPRRLYFAHNQIILFDRKLAEEGLMKHLDFIMRNFELRQTVWIFISDENTPEELLTFETEVESIPALGLVGTIQRQGANEKTGVRTLQEFMRDGMAEPRSTACGVLRIVQTHTFPEGDIVSPPAEGSPQTMKDLFIEGTAVFLDKKLKTILDGPETMGYRLVTGEVDQGLIVFDCPGCAGNQQIALELVNNSVDVEGTLEKGRPKIAVDLSLRMFLGEIQCPLDLLQPEIIASIEKAAGDKAIKMMEAAVQKTQDVNCDIFGFGQALALEDKQWWRQNKKNWPEIFATVPVSYNVKVEVFGTEIRIQQRSN